MTTPIEEALDSIADAINEIPHQQISPEVLKLIVAATIARTILDVKYNK